MLRVAYLLSHPIQYQSPLLRRLEREPGLHLTVFYTSDFSLRAYTDRGFRASVEWDVPLLGGYRHEVLPRLLDGSEITFFRPLARGISRRLRQGSFDVLWIHGYATLNSWIAMMAAKRLGIPVLLRTDSTLIDHPRGLIKLALKKVFFRILRRFVYGVLSVGEKNAEYWRHHLGDDIPLFPVPYAVDNCFFQQRCQAAAATREDLRRELRLEPDRPIILFCSKLLARKRCMDLVEAFFQLRAQPSKNTRRGNGPYLLIVGDGEERAHIEARLRNGGAAANDVRMLGFQNQSELPRYYDLCDIFVLPSVYEPWGLAVNEVMNAGRTVIVSDEVGCQPDLIVDGENGFVFRARDTGSLAHALEHALAEPGRLRNMGEHSRERIQHFSFEADVEGLMRAFITAQNHRAEAAVETG
jgi:glycosyltransferase involved in cell wall biosynthesis